MAQINLLTGRGRSCIECLSYLKQVAKSNNDIGTVSYFLICLDLILDGGYSLESASASLEALENVDFVIVGKNAYASVRNTIFGACAVYHIGSKFNWLSRLKYF